MSRQKIITVLLSVVFIIGIVILINSIGDAEPNFLRTLDETPEVFERNISQVSYQASHLADTSAVFRPAQIRFYDNHVYLNDFSDFTIYEYDFEGNQKRVLTTNRGRGPGEILHLTDFDINDDVIYVADSQSMRVTSYSIETGENIDTFSLENRPMRVTCLKDGFIVQWLGNDLLFSKFDYDGNEILQFGEIVEDQYQHQMSLDGTIRSNRNDRFVYIPFYSSLIYHYESSGELINILKAPDGVHFPFTRREGATAFAPDFSYMRDGYLDENNNLYVYTSIPGDDNQPSEESLISYLDKYNLRTAEYVESIRLHDHYTSVMYNPNDHVIYASDMGFSFKYILDSPF
ncbi:6-bladed beta-propeller [Rhodohalobacter halophilus]|uniref:6-bladed beta-propeller n=1 Tax=Rhodohalobacter halophilus TaxID=1812810 RepID=UPI00083F6A70|nr:6-bladed beta-propeller [Rhodohalobacter halophilus]